MVALFALAAAIAVDPQSWTAWSPRPEIAPRTFRSNNALAVAGNSKLAAFGGWQQQVDGILPGHWYCLQARYRTEGVPHDRTQVQARLDWTGESGKRAGQPEYLTRSVREGEWTRVTIEAPAPENALGVKLQLLLANAPLGTVWWEDIRFDQVEAPPTRPVTIATINLRPSRTGSAAASVKQFIAEIDRQVAKADVILLPEGVSVVGTGKKYDEVSEPVPGPSTAALAELAQRKNAYVVAGIYEREGDTIYNTAVLIDRSGELAGKYRKVYLPREEYESGLTPGSDYPVFQTDFGRVGMMICWDVQYADPARALALAGAEIILLPIWGGNDVLARARAIENHVYLVSSGYDHPSRIIDPSGEVLAHAAAHGSVATATVDLNKRHADKWLGNMRARFQKELRLDVPVSRE